MSIAKVVQKLFVRQQNVLIEHGLCPIDFVRIGVAQDHRLWHTVNGFGKSTKNIGTEKRPQLT